MTSKVSTKLGSVAIGAIYLASLRWPIKAALCFELFSHSIDFGSIGPAFLELLPKVKLVPLLSSSLLLPLVICFFFATILLLPDAYDVFGALLVVYCLGVIALVRPRIFGKQDWLFVSFLFCYPLLMLPSTFIKGAHVSYFDYPLRTLLFFPIVMALRTKADPGLVSRGFFLGGSVGGLAAACFSAYSLLLHPGVRVGAPITNPIPFGQIAAILALIAFVSIFYSSRGWEKVLSVLGFLGGIITLSASGSYGAILGFAIGVLVALAFVSRNRLSRSVWVGILCLALASICIISPWVLFRFNQLLFDVQSFTSGAGMGTSQGQRLILWGISIHELSNSPFFGVGPGHFRQALLRFCATSNCSIGFTPINHAHSQYFDSAINAGLIGLLGLLISLCAPVVLFFRQVPITRGPAQASAIAGLSVVACAMGSMISQPLFAHNISVLTYVVTISICWYLSLSTPARVASVPLHS